MSYKKAIIYSNILELYEYERDITRFGRDRGKVQDTVHVQDLADDRDVSSGEREEAWKGKRQDNKRRAVLAFRRLVLANMAQSSPPLFVTFTYASLQKSISQGYCDFKTCIRNLRALFGKKFRYIVVPEFQKRGAVHFHALFWGLPENLSQTERETRLVALQWGKGYVDVYQTDGNEKLASYLSKYMSKNHMDYRLVGQKTYRASKNVFRPIVDKNAMLIHLEYVYGIGVDNPPCRQKDFMTQ